MAWILKFLPSAAPLLNPWVLVVFLVYSIALSGFSVMQGLDLGRAEHSRYLAAQGAETIRFIVKVEKLKGDVIIRWRDREARTDAAFNTIDKEIAHVPVRPAANITAGWMRVHDAAAEGPDRRVTGAVDDPRDTGITETVALGQVVAPNYRAFHQVASDLYACRAFVTGLGTLTQ